MMHPHGSSEPQIGNRILQLWCNLTDEEISCYEGLRDVFFLAVRKKHGVPRVQDRRYCATCRISLSKKWPPDYGGTRSASKFDAQNL